MNKSPLLFSYSSALYCDAMIEKTEKILVVQYDSVIQSLLSKVILFKHFIFLFKCVNYGPVFGSVVGETSAQ